tara:strand:+ start:1040 stop:1441 length:402 start_codon:yes stop_codon:yes gene_type:complete
MKHLNILFLLFSVAFLTNCNEAQKVKNPPVKQEISLINPEISFGVRGNCGMCKTTIQKAALSVDGVEEASWDTKTKILDIKTKSNIDSITIKLHEAVAKSGYDTELISANDEDYNNLPGCCQYDREMAISSDK